jgi:hypothetical protein
MQWNQLVGISYYTNLEKYSDVAPHSLNRSHTPSRGKAPHSLNRCLTPFPFIIHLHFLIIKEKPISTKIDSFLKCILFPDLPLNVRIGALPLFRRIISISWANFTLSRDLVLGQSKSFMFHAVRYPNQ